MPQALGGVLGNLGGLASIPTWAKVLLGGLTASGEVGNILADRDRAKLLSQENAWSKLTPQQLSARVAAATQPLSQGLTQSVGNQVQGTLGEMGLSEAPGIFQSVLAQVLAPYYQQNQNTALNEILAQMRLPLEASALLPGQTNLSPLLLMLLSSLQKNPGSTGGTNFPGGPTGGSLPIGTPPTIPLPPSIDSGGGDWFSGITEGV